MIDWTEGGWKLPDGEEHLQQWMRGVQRWREDGTARRLTYQSHKYERAMKYVRELRQPGKMGTALDVGAHVGLWSWQMALDFDRVVGFEPVAEHRACWAENLRGYPNAELFPVALGNEIGTVRLKCRSPGSSGDTGVDPVAERSSLRASIDTEGEEAPIVKLDSFGFVDVSFIKLDCEGYEFHALKGGVETLKRCRPVICAEQKPETGMEERYGLKLEDVVRLLADLGAKHRGSIQGDHFFTFG